MGFRKLLLVAGLIFNVTVLCINGNTKNNSSGTIDFCLLDDIIPIHYDIYVTALIEGNDFAFYAESNVSIKICRTILYIGLHSRDQEVNEGAITLTKDDGTIYRSITNTYNNETSITDFMFENEISPGLYTLHINYAVFQGYYTLHSLYTDKEGYAAGFTNSFVSVSARRGFRCFDEPVLKPSFNITVKHDRQYEALSNTQIFIYTYVHKNTDVPIMSETRFFTSPKMSVCTAMFMLLNFKPVPNAKLNVFMWCRSNFTSQVKFAQYIAEKVTQEIGNYTNIYLQKFQKRLMARIPKTDHIAIPNLPVMSYSSWGLIVYNEGNITYDNYTHSITHKMHVAKLITYEMILQWFGNLVTPSDSSDTWLRKEGFISFFQTYILNKIFENWRTMDFMVVENLHGYLRMDIDLTKNLPLKLGIYNASDINTIVPVFYKAPVILRMLQHIITEEVFQKGVIIFLHTHQFKSASSDDLWDAIQTALDESNVLHRDFKIKEVMDSWINQSHYPLVTVTRNYETGKVIISQQNFCFRDDNKNDITHVAKWWIPVTFTTQTNIDFTNTILNFRWLNPKDENIISFVINPNDWIILNLQQTGYYRVNYDDTNWLKIANYLNSDEYTKIHLLNRAQLIDDSFNLMCHGKLKPEIFFNISSYLSRETDYIAWYPMFQILFKLQKFLGLPEIKLFKSHIAGIFDALLENVGNKDVFNEDDITRLKRLNATYWACTIGNTLCLKMATNRLEEHLSSRRNSVLSPYWYQWTYCFGLKIANMDTWRRVWQLYQEIRDQKLLEFLACSENLDIIEHYLNIVLSHNLEETARAFAFRNIITKHISNEHIFNLVLDNFMRLKLNSINMCDVLREIISNACSQKQLRKVRNFLKTNINVDCVENVENVMQERMWYVDNIDKDLEQIMKQLQIQSK